MPILSFITRKDFLDQFKNEDTKNKAYIGYNAAILFLSFLVTFF